MQCICLATVVQPPLETWLLTLVKNYHRILLDLKDKKLY